jgi:hypothetical protein
MRAAFVTVICSGASLGAVTCAKSGLSPIVAPISLSSIFVLNLCHPITFFVLQAIGAMRFPAMPVLPHPLRVL